MTNRGKPLSVSISYLLSLVILCAGSVALGQRGDYEEPFVDPLGDKPKANKDAIYIGANLSLGQARSTESNDSPGMAYLVGIDPGYTMTLGSWSRMEVGGEFMFGQANYRLPAEDGGKIEIPIGYALLAKIGYGYSMGNNLFGLWKLGVGPAQAKFSAKPSGGGTIKSKDPMTGLAGLLEFMMLIPMSGSLEATGGFRWTYMEYDLDEVEIGGQPVSVGKPVIFNMPQVNVGLRVKF